MDRRFPAVVRLLAVAVEQEVPYCGVGNNPGGGGGASRKSAKMIKTPSRPKTRGGGETSLI